jgi:hypothetical protein
MMTGNLLSSCKMSGMLNSRLSALQYQVNQLEKELAEAKARNSSAEKVSQPSPETLDSRARARAEAVDRARLY